MTLSVIGAGLGGTATFSLKFALEHLGLGPCYHMSEVVKGATTYSVYEGTAPGKEAASAVLTQMSATIATINGLHGGTTYYFRVSATNEAGQGTQSAEANAAPSSPANSSSGGGSFDVASLWLLFLACVYRIAMLKSEGSAHRVA